MWQRLFFSLILVASLCPSAGLAQTLHQDLQEQLSAEVLEVVSESKRTVTGTDTTVVIQEIRAILLEGERKGEVVRFDNELVTLKPGDKIIVNRMTSVTGEEYFIYSDFERRPTLIFVAVAFILMLLVFSGWQGMRALLSLAASIAAIFFLLVPALLAGFNPVLVSVGVAGAVLALVLFGTHGINPRSIIAFGGTISAVIVTGLIALISSNAMRLTGFSSDASVYLNFATNGSLNLSGLLLGGIIIGILGVLDDVSITQASVVEQLKRANPALKFGDLYQGAIKVGKDHIGSLVNTLALAYVGVSLPLILLYASSNSLVWQTLNQEVVAVELLRIIVGSMGLILAVPATTAVAAWYFSNHQASDKADSVVCADHKH